MFRFSTLCVLAWLAALPAAAQPGPPPDGMPNSNPPSLPVQPAVPRPAPPIVQPAPAPPVAPPLHRTDTRPAILPDPKPQAIPALPPPIVITGPRSSLTLGQAALQAVRSHPDLKIAEAQIEAAQAQLDQSSAGWYPRISGTVRSTYSENQNASTGGQNLVRSGGVRNYAASVSASQTLLDFGQTRNAVNAAQHSRDAVEWDAQTALQDLLLRVSESYFTTLQQQQAVLIQEDNVRNAQVQLERARGFFEAGTRAKIEVTRAEADLANANLALIQARNALSKARVGLYVNMAVGAEGPAEPEEVTVVPPPWGQEEAVNVSHEFRPDLQAQLARAESSRSNLKQAHSAYWPTIGLSYTYGWSDNLFPPQPYTWNAGLTMNIPIFNEPVLGAQVRLAMANLKQSEFRYDSLLLTTRQSVVEAWLNLREAVERHRAALAGLASAQENYRLASERYQVGVGASLDVSDAQRLLVQARSQEVQARFDIQLASLRLYRQTGKLTLEGLVSAGAPSPAVPPPAAPPGEP